MIIFDVNVLVYACRREAEAHEDARSALTDAVNGGEVVGLSDETLVACARITTNHRIVPRPLTPEQVTTFCDRLRAAPRVTVIVPSDRTWRTFTELVTGLNLRAKSIPDAWLAAQAIALSARFVTFDRGFRRFPGLDVRILGDAATG